jgi:hypothetical protein
MYWFVRVFTDPDDEYDWTNCCVLASSARQACFLAKKHTLSEGYNVHYVEAQTFEQSDHGDPRDYEIIGLND